MKHLIQLAVICLFSTQLSVTSANAAALDTFFASRAKLAWDNYGGTLNEAVSLNCPINVQQAQAKGRELLVKVRETRRDHIKLLKEIDDKLGGGTRFFGLGVGQNSATINKFEKKGLAGNACQGSFDELYSFTAEKIADVEAAQQRLRDFRPRIGWLFKQMGAADVAVSPHETCSKEIQEKWKTVSVLVGNCYENENRHFCIEGNLDKSPLNAHLQMEEDLVATKYQLEKYRISIDTMKRNCGGVLAPNSKPQ